MDSKLGALVELVTTTHLDEKVLVFTEYKDTAEYVATALKDSGVDKVALVTGDTDDPTGPFVAFAPVSNRKPNEPERTVARRGSPTPHPHRDRRALRRQNLQDAPIVVNYDLPWAIIRLIQRAGRVDRVGQKAEEILIYSFFHESVENVISLRQRIKDRLAANAEAFGSDEVSSVPRTRPRPSRTSTRVNSTTRRSTSRSTPPAWPTRSGCGLRRRPRKWPARSPSFPTWYTPHAPSTTEDDAAGIACYVRTENGNDGFGFGAENGDLRLLTGHEALRVFRSDMDTLGLPMRDDHFDLTAALARGPLAKPTSIEGRLRGIRKRVWNRLNGHLVSLNADVGEALEALFRRPLTRDAERRLKSALATRADDGDLADLVALLYRDNRLVIPDTTGSDPIRIVCTMGVIR